MLGAAVDNIYYIGVDGGGTKTRAVLVNSDLEIIDTENGEAANINTNLDGAYKSICGVIDNLLDRHNLSLGLVKIGIGVAGYSVLDKRIAIDKLLRDKYLKIRLNSDSYIACLAAHKGKAGSILACGTGIVGYCINDNGQGYQFAGWGFPHGDLGGAAWLGLEIGRSLCKAIDGVSPWNQTLSSFYNDFFSEDAIKCKMWLIQATSTDYAQITKFVLSKTPDEFVRSLIDHGVAEIAGYIGRLKDHNPDLPIKLVGGLAKLYIDKLQKIYPDLTLSDAEQAMGAVYMVKD